MFLRLVISEQSHLLYNEKKVREHEGWYKDMTSGLIDCANSSEYEKYMKSYHADQKGKEDFEFLYKMMFLR